jgi:hypothetical protein
VRQPPAISAPAKSNPRRASSTARESPWGRATRPPERSSRGETGAARYPARATAELEQLLGLSTADFNLGEYQATEAENARLALEEWMRRKELPVRMPFVHAEEIGHRSGAGRTWIGTPGVG